MSKDRKISTANSFLAVAAATTIALGVSSTNVQAQDVTTSEYFAKNFACSMTYGSADVRRDTDQRQYHGTNSLALDPGNELLQTFFDQSLSKWFPNNPDATLKDLDGKLITLAIEGQPEGHIVFTRYLAEQGDLADSIIDEYNENPNDSLERIRKQTVQSADGDLYNRVIESQIKCIDLNLHNEYTQAAERFLNLYGRENNHEDRKEVSFSLQGPEGPFRFTNHPVKGDNIMMTNRDGYFVWGDEFMRGGGDLSINPDVEKRLAFLYKRMGNSAEEKEAAIPGFFQDVDKTMARLNKGANGIPLDGKLTRINVTY